ncbi:hypothetical protein JCM6882_003661 [Rhodosporidiobolus microsporus]
MRPFALLLASAVVVAPALAHSSSKECAGRAHTKAAGKQRLDMNSLLSRYAQGSKTKGSSGSDGQFDSGSFSLPVNLHAAQPSGDAAAAFETATTTVAQATTTQAPAPKTTTKAAAATHSSSSSSGGSSAAAGSIEQIALDAHNALRTAHGASALTWSTDLVASAKTWADKCVFQHGGGKDNGAGENLSGYTGGSNVEWGIQMWTDEASLYNYDVPGYTDGVGHFTQMVWKDTTELGCAEVKCDSLPNPTTGKSMTDAFFLVCHYLSAGNIVGNNNEYFRLNVLPASS